MFLKTHFGGTDSSQSTILRGSRTLTNLVLLTAFRAGSISVFTFKVGTLVHGGAEVHAQDHTPGSRGRGRGRAWGVRFQSLCSRPPTFAGPRQ